MRTTLDLPDDLYRVLKARAALAGMPLRRLVESLIRQSLREPLDRAAGPNRREPPPVIVPPSGRRIPALSRARLRRLEEEEDEAKRARSA